MQLARQIQQTFLPSELPALAGWEINLWWRTAREVGGDFFDLFLLPSGELGLLIADVADKGMGAAMYMILIRTLIRATVLESRSPAEVLERVNQLLLPDAHQGMFVTLFYGVLDPQSGLFRYANAGHNPPLWIRKEACEIELLPRSGMALGVVDENEIEERDIALLPGDFLILYTDGVTDALNAEGVIYGSERLYQVVWEAAFGDPASSEISADFMLQKMDSSISDFVGDTPVVDDSTMLVLYRQLGG
jgi:serine phosphatase RsbU (regulator of sigma subunit)